MFAKDRLNNLYLEIQNYGEVSVKELSLKHNVTEDSIRKDLKTLEKEGLILRTYGGAKLKKSFAYYKSLASRIDENIESKEAIAQKAFSIINNNDTIFLDISTINIVLAEILSKSDKNITIVTNMIDILNIYEKCKNKSKIIFIGGTYRPDLHGFIGSHTIELIKKYRVNKSFVSTCGINIHNGNLTTLEVEDGLTKKTIIDISEEAFLISESSKINNDSFFTFGNLSDIKGFIFDEFKEEFVLEKLKKFDLTLM